MREAVLEQFKLSKEAICRDGKPLVLLIDRGHGTRNMQNLEDVRKLLVDTTPHATVEVVLFHIMSIEAQVKAVSRASALVGFHGSGLAHVLWMPASGPHRPTYLVEILPYNYSCRDWYETGASVAGVQYTPAMNTRPPANVTDEQLISCWADPARCPTLGCHDLLRDQPTSVDLEDFNRTWAPIAQQLRETDCSL
jgi:hypothetical protein